MISLPHGKLLPADAYAEAYGREPGFEAVCIAARQGRNAEFLRAEQPASILEVGCGPELLCARPDVQMANFNLWAIAEPASAYAARARAATAHDARFRIVENYVESAGAELRGLAPAGFDAAVVSGLVHETTDPKGLLTVVRDLLRPGGRILISAPNALSFHRLLAVDCGLIDTPYRLSDADLRLGHPVVFDPQSLAALTVAAGFADIQGDGYLFKPFTNAQMQVLVELAGAHIVDGLIALGRRFPEHAAEICVTAVRP